jgi:hypothetical protein
LALSGDYYCYNRFNVTSVEHFCVDKSPEDLIRHECTEATPESIGVWQGLFGQCLQKAADMGFDLEINLRIDDGRTLEGWRNTILFSPTEVYGNYSYETAFIDPVVDLLTQLSYDGDLSFTVLGEMGASALFYAEDWIGIMERVRQRLDDSRSASAPPVKIGVQLNNNKICGCFNVGFVGSYEEFLKAFEEGFDPVSKGIDVEAFHDLLAAADYLGVSAYVAIEDPENFQACEFESLLTRLDDELKFFNTSIAEITRDGTTTLHFSETGVGGGGNQDGKTPALSAKEAARRPYWGIRGPPSDDCSNDPFRMCECNRATGVCVGENEIREYRRRFYENFSSYLLSNKGNCTYERDVSDVYLWSTGSWDVLGLYQPDRLWTDPVVIDTLVKHNLAASAL